MDTLNSANTTVFTVVAALVVSGLILLALQMKKKSDRRWRRINLPPGPRGWPVVGNLFQFASSKKPFFEYVDELRAKYGPIFTLRMGTRTMIILSDASLVQEALIERGPIFASRPRENPTRAVFSCNKFTVNAAVYGPVWRSLRRNMVQNMLGPARLREFRAVRDSAMDRLVGRLRAEAEANGGSVGVLRNARFAAFCILLEMCFGLEMDEETVERTDEMMKKVLLTLDPRIDDYLPILSPFFSKQRRRALEVRKQQLDYIVPLIRRRKTAVETPGSDSTAMPFSYLDTLFDLKVDPASGRKTAVPTEAELVTLCSEFLNGGTDTTGTAIEWGVAQLIANPHVQSKLYEEIRSTVGGGVDGKRVDEKDVEKMPYLHAVVKELLRKHPPTYFSLTHAVTEPTKLAGYDIPTDANVEIYLPPISVDPNLWSDPEKFDPDRHTAAAGKEDADVTGVRGVKMIPFGAGRRICPGLAMATVHVHLMLARMVQEFEWRAYRPDSKIDFAAKSEFTVVMKNPLVALIMPRKA
ncbi:hypothetical protein SAY86_002389 [Trapa natans]|uniref:Cytochrome P450 77A3 n=1 Tax=Trapa natans TaxID=22666 RepID=A0AAN7LHR8_TRANT|nr:hypothetical protein SAY86_002389 [Trapa natans]